MLSPGAIRLFSRCQSSGRWRFGIPLPLVVAQREDALLGARPLLVAAGAAERGVEPAASSASSSACVFSRPQHRCVPTRERLRAVGDRLVVGVDDQPGADHRRCTGRGTRSSRGTCRSCRRGAAETGSARVERLLREPQHDRRVLADRIEHDRPLELGHDLPDDVDALGLEQRGGGRVGAPAQPGAAWKSSGTALELSWHARNLRVRQPMACRGMPGDQREERPGRSATELKGPLTIRMPAPYRCIDTASMRRTGDSGWLEETMSL